MLEKEAEGYTRVHVVFERQDDGVRGGLEGTFCNGFNGFLEVDISGHGEAMGDDRLLVGRLPLPAVQLHAAAACQQHLAVHLSRGYS